MKPTEYGGSDTVKTKGIQPAPHVLTADEKLRLMYGADPASIEVEPVVGLDPASSQLT